MSDLPLSLDDLLQARSVERNRVEFKSTWDEWTKLATVQTVCALPMTS